MNISSYFKEIINKAPDADSAFTAMREFSIKQNSEPAHAYSFMYLLRERFNKNEVISAVKMFSYFDEGAFSKVTDNRIKVAYKRFDAWLDKKAFEKCIQDNNIAGFIDGDVLYVIHPCVKPGENKWQCTSFGRGVGPLGDSTRKTIEELVDGSATAVLPTFARFVPFDELDKLLTCQFNEPVIKPEHSKNQTLAI